MYMCVYVRHNKIVAILPEGVFLKIFFNETVLPMLIAFSIISFVFRKSV